MRALAAIAAFWTALHLAGYARADVAVLANRTPQAIQLRVSPEVSPTYDLRLAPGEVRPLVGDESLLVAFATGAGRRAYTLDPNSVYYFGVTGAGEVDLQKIGLGDEDRPAVSRPLPGDPELTEPLVIPVRLLVDDDEPTHRTIWERKLRARAAAASRLLTEHAGVALRVVGVGTWESTNTKTDFADSLSEFERVVDPSPARLAIGFTSQYEVVRGRVHLGGTRGPLRRHILIREWSGRVSERERLELLLHELGHFLGATHSPQLDSVMRPLLGDERANRRDFQLRYDAVNTLVMSMVSEELRRRGVQRFADLTVGTKQRLRQIYGVFRQALPDDPSAKNFEQRVAARRAEPSRSPTSQVLQAIVAAARDNVVNGKPTHSGDALTERYVRAAAAAAAKLPEGERAAALLMALGIAMDDGAALRRLPLTRGSVLAAEDDVQRWVRLSVLGKPTVRGRRDLAKHFFISAFIAGAHGAATANQIGLAKEVFDSQGGSGFSFVDVAANRAGIRFARAVLAGRYPPSRLARQFSPEGFMPDISGLDEGMTGQELLERFGDQADQRYAKQLAEIDRRIDGLPVYAPIRIEF